MTTHIERLPFARHLSTFLDERVLFALLTLTIAGFYLVVRAPVLDPINYLDPWIYTATFTNYHFIVTEFPYAYYPSRLPWIIPGILVNKAFSPVTAFFVLHVVFFVGAGLFAFLLFRAYFGRHIALIVYAALMLTPLFYDAFSNDYPDGAILAYAFGAAYFALGAWKSRRRGLRFALAGFCLAGAVGTNLFAGFLVVGIALVYVTVFHVEAKFWRHALRDGVSSSIGGLILALGCGAFSRANGGEFLFFMPSVRAAQTINAADYKAHGYEWLKAEPELLLPLFALCALGILLSPRVLRHWRDDASVRFAAGSGLFLAYFTALIGYWEFADGGDFLETPYYFSLFNVGIAMVLGSVLYLLCAQRLATLSEHRVGVVIAGAILLSAVPTFFLYRLRLLPFGEHATVLALALMGVGLAAIVLSRFGPCGLSSALGVAGMLTVLFLANYAGASGLLTRSVFTTTGTTFRERKETLSLSTQLIQFMRKYKLQGSPPAFWYDANAQLAFTGMQSTYLWADTWVGLEMPRIDDAMRSLLDERRPEHLVLLCVSRGCSGAEKVLDRAGYATRLIADRNLVSGDLRVWVRALSVLEFEQKRHGFYEQSQSAFLTSAEGTSLGRWSFASGVPFGWTPVGGVKMTSRPAGGRVVTTNGRYAYEFQSATVRLAPGSYAVRVGGAVSRGGLQLGVLDVKADKWLKETQYWSGQHRSNSGSEMGLDFTLPQTTRVQLGLSNWAPKDRSSTWVLRDAQLVRVG